MEAFTPLFQAIIAFCAFFSFQFVVFMGVLNLSLKPIKEKLSKLEDGQAKLEDGQAKLEDGQAKLEAEIKSLRLVNS